MTHVATTFLGIWLLHPLKNAANAHNRVIVVASGGDGMFTAKRTGLWDYQACFERLFKDCRLREYHSNLPVDRESILHLFRGRQSLIQEHQ